MNPAQRNCGFALALFASIGGACYSQERVEGPPENPRAAKVPDERPKAQAIEPLQIDLSAELRRMREQCPGARKVSLRFGFLSPDGNLLLLVLYADAVVDLGPWSYAFLCDLKERRCLGPLWNEGRGHPEKAVFSRDGTRFVIERPTDALYLWDAVQRKELLKFEGTKYTGRFLLSPDGKLLAANTSDAKRGSIGIWDTASGAHLRAIGAGHGEVIRFKFSGDFAALVTEHHVLGELPRKPPGKPEFTKCEVTAHLWDVATGKHLSTIGAPTVWNLPVGELHLLLVARDAKLAEVGADVASFRACRSPTGVILLVSVGEARFKKAYDVSTDAKMRMISLSQPKTAKEQWRCAVPGGCGWPLTTVITSSKSTKMLALIDQPNARCLFVWEIPDVDLAPTAKDVVPRMEELWREMGEDDFAKADHAAFLLRQCPVQSVAFLATHVRPVAKAAHGEIARLIDQLDNEDFTAREKAEATLLALGEQTISAMKNVANKRQSLEARGRIRRILDSLEGRSPPATVTLRSIRAVVLLGQCQNLKEARDRLRLIAGGAEDVWLTQEAKRVLGELPAP